MAGHARSAEAGGAHALRIEASWVAWLRWQKHSFGRGLAELRRLPTSALERPSRCRRPKLTSMSTRRCALVTRPSVAADSHHVQHGCASRSPGVNLYASGGRVMRSWRRGSFERELKSAHETVICRRRAVRRDRPTGMWRLREPFPGGARSREQRRSRCQGCGGRLALCRRVSVWDAGIRRGELELREPELPALLTRVLQRGGRFGCGRTTESAGATSSGSCSERLGLSACDPGPTASHVQGQRLRVLRPVFCEASARTRRTAQADPRSRSCEPRPVAWNRCGEPFSRASDSVHSRRSRPSHFGHKREVATGCFRRASLSAFGRLVARSERATSGRTIIATIRLSLQSASRFHGAGSWRPAIPPLDRGTRCVAGRRTVCEAVTEQVTEGLQVQLVCESTSNSRRR